MEGVAPSAALGAQKTAHDRDAAGGAQSGAASRSGAALESDAALRSDAAPRSDALPRGVAAERGKKTVSIAAPKCGDGSEGTPLTGAKSVFRPAFIRCAALTVIFCLGFFVRLFAVIRFESVIHEFDPYFNFRTTKALQEFGPTAWWNWYDRWSWYPLGRVVGQTLFPGLMVTAFSMWTVLDKLGLKIDIRDLCVFTAPIFSAFTALATYLLVNEMEIGRWRDSAGLLAALLITLSPSYMSRSVAGSYDNEAVAIFALVFCFYTIARAYRVGTIPAAMAAAFAYFYMVACWGGYVFIVNTVSAHALALCVLGRTTPRHYLTFNIFYVLGTLLCFNVPFVGLQAVTSSEHLTSHGVFLIYQALHVFKLFRSLVPLPSSKAAMKGAVASAVLTVGAAIAFLIATGRTRFGGRSMTLLDPTYASRHIPIIASVSEHQPPLWTTYIFDLHAAAFLAPAGLCLVFYAAAAPGGDGALLLGLYGVLAFYFSCKPAEAGDRTLQPGKTHNSEGRVEKNPG